MGAAPGPLTNGLKRANPEREFPIQWLLYLPIQWTNIKSSILDAYF
jgi:hypothetical protein